MPNINNLAGALDKMMTVDDVDVEDDEMYNSKMKSVNDAERNSKAIALTSDFWTSLCNKSYCGIIGHWITDDWNLISVVLECMHVVERHYSTNIAELCRQFGID